MSKQIKYVKNLIANINKNKKSAVNSDFGVLVNISNLMH